MTGTASAGRLAAVLFDMDGTLVDSEKVWDITLADTARWLGGELSAAGRAAMVGTDMAATLRLLRADLGMDIDDAQTEAYLVARTLEHFRRPLPWRPGAQELIAAVRAARLPAALVTSTPRELVDLAMGTLGAASFDAVVCGDEVRHTKPHPEPYLRAAALLGADPARCVAIEDSPAGVASAEAAGCPVLVAPSEVRVPPGPGRTVVADLVGITVADLTGLLRVAA